MITTQEPVAQPESARPDRTPQRRLALLRRAGLFTPDTHGAKIVRACTRQDLRSAYRLVHETFVETGYILPHPSGMRVRTFEAVDDMATYVAKLRDEVVGVQSVIPDSHDLGLPSDQSFKEELDQLRARGARVCEATNQAVAPAFRKSGVTTELMRVGLAHGFALDCQELITTVSPGHVRFYEFLGFRAVSGVRSYSDKVEDPVVVVSLDAVAYRNHQPDDGSEDHFIRKFILDDNPYLRYVRSWDFLARKLFNDPALLRALFVEEARLLEECSDREREILLHRWGRDLFAQTLGVCLAPEAA